MVSLGSQDFQKGFAHLIEAAAGLASTYPRLVVVVAGRPGQASQELESLRDQLGVSETVQFLGHRDDAPEILAAGDIFALPSLFEGFPGAVLEAMALSLPVVASDIPPVREIVRPGETGPPGAASRSRESCQGYRRPVG